MGRMILVALACFFTSGCLWPVYSKHNLNEGANILGGGYRLDFVEPGIYKITATTNLSMSQHPNTARKMWRDQAVKACGGDNYIEQDVFEHKIVHEHFWLQRPDEYQNVKMGTAICLGFANPSSYQYVIVDAKELENLIRDSTMSGKTKKGNDYQSYYAPDGTMIGIVTTRYNTEFEDSGTWEVTNEGQFCETWNKWLNRTRNCYLVFAMKDGQYQMKTTGEPGNYVVVIRDGDPGGVKT